MNVSKWLDNVTNGPRRGVFNFALAAVLAVITFIIVWRGLPVQIDGMKKLLVVALAAAVNFTLAMLVLGGSDADAELTRGEDDASADSEISSAPVVVSNMTFSDPMAIVFALVASACAFVLLIFASGLLAATRIVLGGLLLMLPGYLLSVMVLPRPLGVVGRLLFAAVLSAATVPVVAQILYSFGILFSFWIALVSTLGLTLALLVVYRFRHAIARQAQKLTRRKPAQTA